MIIIKTLLKVYIKKNQYNSVTILEKIAEGFVIK